MSGARPKGNAIVWANGTVYSAPATTWDAMPIKVIPTAGIITAGFAPQEEPAAERVNAIFYDHGARLDAMDLAELNWTDPKDSGFTGTPGDFALMRWPEGPARFYGAASTISKSIDEGATWSTAYTPPGGTTGVGVAAHSLYSALYLYHTASAGLFVRNGHLATGADTWTAQAFVSGATDVLALKVDELRNYYWIGGSRSAGAGAGLWRLTEAQGAAMAELACHPTSATGVTIQQVAVGPTYILSAGWTGSASSMYRTDPTTGTTTTVTSPNPTFRVLGLEWSDEDATFYACTTNAASGFRIFTSTDGTTWTQTGSESNNLPQTPAAGSAFAVRGSLLLMGCQGQSAAHALVGHSIDGGVTWSYGIAPTRPAGTVPVTRMRNVGRRVYAWGVDGVTAHVWSSQTFRLGR